VVVHAQVTRSKDGSTSEESRYYISSLDKADRTLSQWEALVRGHWGAVEARNHWRRDAVWGEDRSRTRNANALAVLALLRCTLLSTLSDLLGDTPLPQTLEACHASPAYALKLLRQMK
jgi:predicted transposase YbfD/YdcC